MKIYIYQIADRSIYIFFIYVSYRLVVTVLSNTPRASWKVKLTGTSPRRARNFASTICFLSRLFAQNLSGDDGHIRRARGSTRSLHPRRPPRATVRGIKQPARRPASESSRSAFWYDANGTNFQRIKHDMLIRCSSVSYIIWFLPTYGWPAALFWRNLFKSNVIKGQWKVDGRAKTKWWTMPLENCGSIHLALKTSLFFKIDICHFWKLRDDTSRWKKFGNQERNEEKTTVN